MLERAQDCVKNYIPTLSTPLVVAVSGGVDSMLLLFLLIEMKYSNIHVVHINHGLRTEAENDAKFVERYADMHGLTFHCSTIDIALKAKQAKRNIEDMGRSVRYAFLEEIRAQHNAPWVLLGHHADDLIESQLLHIERGSGLFGLVGFEESDSRRHILRPFLSYRKQELHTIAKQRSIMWREDSSNSDTAFSRNRLRLSVIPKLKEKFPTLYKDMQDISQSATEILKEIYSTLEKKLGKQFEKAGSWQLQGFRGCTEDERSFALLWILRYWRPGSTYTEKGITDRGRQLLTIQSGRTLQLTRDFSLRRSFEYIDIVDTALPPQEIRQFETLPSAIEWKQNTISFHTEATPSSNIAAPISLLQDGFTLRSRQPQDKLPFIHNGTLQHRSLKKFFIDNKIPQDKRDHIPLLISRKSGEIVAILSHEIYYRHPLTSETTQLVTIHIT